MKDLQVAIVVDAVGAVTDRRPSISTHGRNSVRLHPHSRAFCADADLFGGVMLATGAALLVFVRSVCLWFGTDNRLGTGMNRSFVLDRN